MQQNPPSPFAEEEPCLCPVPPIKYRVRSVGTQPSVCRCRTLHAASLSDPPPLSTLLQTHNKSVFPEESRQKAVKNKCAAQASGWCSFLFISVVNRAQCSTFFFLNFAWDVCEFRQLNQFFFPLVFLIFPGPTASFPTPTLSAPLRSVCPFHHGASAS